MQEDPVPSHEHFAASVFHGFQERVEHLSSVSHQLLEEDTDSSRGQGPVTRPVIHAAHHWPGFVPGAGDAEAHSHSSDSGGTRGEMAVHHVMRGRGKPWAPGRSLALPHLYLVLGCQRGALEGEAAQACGRAGS